MSFSKAGGPDGVPMQILEHLTDSAITELTRIINLSWTTGSCPAIWKSSRLIPIPKAKPGAYRPISLTNAFARVADRLITRRLTHFLEQFDSIPGEQAGFRRAMSAEMQSCSFVEWVSQKQQDGEHVNCVFLDASAAYDNVRHDILMARLGALDPPARLTRWINSFIRGRMIDTQWGSTVSGKRSMHRGVPQGASMSPILWLIYTSPIFDHLQIPGLSQHRADFMPFMYADDIAIAVSSKSPTSLQVIMQQLLDHIAEFCRQSCITLNPSKSVQVIISTSYKLRETPLPQLLRGAAIPASSSTRFLGILVNSNMNFTEQCLAARRRIQQRLQIVQATSGQSWGLNQHSTTRLVNQYVLSSGLYGASAYFGLAPKHGQQHVQTAYNQCLRTITGCTKTTPIPQLFEVAGAPTLQDRISRQASNLANIAKRHTTQTPSLLVLSSQPRQPRIRRGKQSWRQMAEIHLPTSLLPLPVRPPPWAANANVSVHLSQCASSDLPSVKLSAALECLAQVGNASQPHRFEVWTDGSVSDEGTGGSGFLIIEVTDGRAYNT